MAALSPRESVRRAQRDVRHQHLLDAAERVFAAKGYGGTRMQDVAAEAGLSLATVYGLVTGKETLYAEVHRSRGRALLERASRAASRSGSAREALVAGVAAYVEFLAEHPHYLHIHLKESQAWGLAPRFSSEEQLEQWRDGLALTVEVFRAGIAEGSIVDEDPETLARVMIASHQVFLAKWVEDGMRETPPSLAARMQAHAQRSFVRGTKPARSG